MNAKSNPIGRPPVIDDTALQKLREAFLWGCTDVEACLHADISPATLYNYQADHPEYLEQKKRWKEDPVLKARKCLVQAAEKNPKYSIEYLKRKKKDEFSEKQVIEQEGEIKVTIQRFTPGSASEDKKNE